MKIRSPNAIVGVACRLPGSIRSIDELTCALNGREEPFQAPPPSRSGLHGILNLPPRFGFIEDGILTGFPFDHYGLSRAEAESLDPIQRLILHLVWEAIEDGRRTLDAIRGARTGVYLGLGASDWSHRALGPNAKPSAHGGTGAWTSVAAGRVAYLLGITGPTLCVDTACSSGLTAAHLALRDLRAGTIDRAIVASANLLLDSSSTHTLMAIGALSPTGHCRPFDHRADGYVRSEGGVALLLENQRIHAQHTRVHGWLVGSAINHDGSSNGLTAPSSRSQQDVLLGALSEADWAPSTVDFLEAHGTGTPLGDPIEWSAIRAVYGEGDTPCRVGSLKGTHGHLEAVSGLAGILRVLATFRQKRTFPQPWLEEINPRIDLEGTRLLLPQTSQEGKVERAGVSAFGLSGTNVHALLQAPEFDLNPTPVPPPAETPALVLGLSGPSPEALRDQVQHWKAHVGSWSAEQLGARAQIKPVGVHRAACVLGAGSSPKAWIAQLENSPIHKAKPRLRIGFAYTGQAAQVAGMAMPLMEQEPLFHHAMTRAGDVYRGLTGRELSEVLQDQALLDHTSFTQPALFAVEWSLTRLMAAWNLHPVLVLGHSVGEIAAACAAGVFTMEQAMELAVARGRALGDLPEGGAMAAIEASLGELLPSLPEDVVIAGINGPRSTTISGGSSSIEQVIDHWSRAQRMAHKLAVSHAFHSPRMAPASEALRNALERVTPKVPTLPWYSTLTGKEATAAAASSAYWGEQLLRPVRFHDAVLAAQSQVDVFVELGPKPVLTSLAQAFSDRPWMGTLHASRDEVRSLRETVARLWSLGAPVDRSSWGATVSPADLPPRAIKGGTLPLQPDGAKPIQNPPHDTPYLSMRWAPSGGSERAEGKWTHRDDPACARILENTAFRPQDGPPRHLLIHPKKTGPDACREVQTALSHAKREGLTLWVITSGMQREEPSEEASALWALAACIESEHPLTWGGILDVNSIDDPQISSVLGRAPRAHLDPSGLLVPHLSASRDLPSPRSESLGRVLVLGGTGSIGQSIVQWAQGQGAREIHVATRNLPTADEQPEGVQHHTCDAGDPNSLASLLSALEEEDRLDVVVHAAGQAHRSTTTEASHEVWERAWQPRSTPLETLETKLHHDTRVVLIGSVVTFLGGQRLAPYAAACGVLEAKVLGAQSRGRPWSLIRLGPWHGGGLIPADELQNLIQSGQRLVQPHDLHDAVKRALHTPTSLTVCPADWTRFGRVLQARRSRPFLEEITPPEAHDTHSKFPPSETLKQVIQELLGRLPDPKEGFFEAGFDSLLAVELARRLEVRLGRSVPVAHVFDHPSIEALSRFLTGEDASSSRVISPTGPADLDEPLVVCAMACRFPGAASPEQYADVLESGVSRVGPVPAERFTDLHRRAGFVDGVDQFDPDAFGLAHREALAIDPQQRMLLEMGREVMDRAGPLANPETLVGVYVGIGHSEYWRRLQTQNTADAPHPSYPWSGTGNASSFAAGRLAHVLGLKGPALAIDTACSSSLVALHTAIQALRAGECSAALVGGANALLEPDSFTYLESVGALSPSGVCRVFDQDADGYVRGEGCGMVLVARQSEAERQGWPVLAQILGSSIAHDGPASGLTVPNGAAQERVIRTALADARCLPEDVDYVETHGTGTALGDPIELAALARIHSQRTRPLQLGSVKPSIGHLEAASGIASVIKVILAMERGRIPATLHHERPTVHWPEGFDAQVVTALADWGGVRTAGVSSFGLSGTNAHVVLRSAEPCISPPTEDHLTPLETASAESGERLDLWWSAWDSSGLSPTEKAAALARYPAQRFRRVRVGDHVMQGEVKEAVPSVGILVDLSSTLTTPRAEDPRDFTAAMNRCVAGWAAKRPHLTRPRAQDSITEGVEWDGARALVAIQQLLAWGIPIDAFCWVDPHAVLRSLWETNPQLHATPCPKVCEPGPHSWWTSAGDHTESPDVVIDLSPQPTSLPIPSISGLAGGRLSVEQMLRCAGELWTMGVPIARDQIHPPRPVKGNPARPFLRERVWIPRAPEPTQRWLRRWRSVYTETVPAGEDTSHVLPGTLTGASLIAEALRILRDTEGPLTLVWENQAEESSTTPGSDALALMAARTSFETEDPTRRIQLWLGPPQARLTSPVDTEDVIWMREGVPHAPRLEAAPFAATPYPTIDGHWLVTGGRGALGEHVVAWLEGRGASVTTLGRTPLEPTSETTLHACVDVSETKGFEAWLQAHGPFDGAVHCAGIESRVWAHEMSDEELAKAFGAKVDGARCLDAHIEGPLILFGSAISWFGLPGQTAYASANAWLEGLMDQRHQRGLPGTCVVWGPWTEGMASHLTHEAGTEFMTPAIALDALSRSIDGEAVSSIFNLKPSLFIDRYHRIPTWLKSWGPDRRQGASPASLSVIEATSLVARLASDVLGRPKPLSAQQGFADAGMDSIMAVELARRLSTHLGEPLSLTAAFDHPRVDRLAAQIARSPDITGDLNSSTPHKTGTPIAIVGMALRFPGSSDQDQLWESLMGQRIEIQPVPPTRWPTAGMEASTAYGGFLEDIDLFDPAPFGITPKEARSMDPQQRLLLDVAREALERGKLIASLDGSRTGTFLGIADRGYLRRFPDEGSSRYRDAWAGTGNETSFAAGRMAHALGLTGPAIALNTTCSSSLVAVDLARRALLDGTCDQAIAGGVHLMLTPDESSYLAQLGALSPSGRCHSFDDRADGYVRSEACGIVVLKRLDDAIRDQNPVHAILHASATNHDGRASGLTVPSGEAQRHVIASAWSQVDPETGELGLLEAHGTGTPLGDPIEYRAAQEALRERCSRPVVVRSIKANLGHAELAAGIAGLISAVTCLEREAIPAMPNLNMANPNLPEGPLTLARETTPWPRSERPRLAAISAFGLSGTNAHIVVGEAPDPTRSTRHAPPSPRQRTRHWLEGDRFFSPPPLLRISWAKTLAKPIDKVPLAVITDETGHPLGERLDSPVLAPSDAIAWLSQQEGPAGLILVAPREEPELHRQVFEWMRLAHVSSQRDQTRVWYLTQEGAAVDSDERLSTTGALFSALARTLLVEFPETSGGWCDVDSWVHLDRSSLPESGYLAVREKEVWSPTLTPGVSPGTQDPLPQTWVITGGLGALGLHTASYLVNLGAREVHLIGRTPFDQLSGTDKGAHVEQLRQQGCHVVTHAADVADKDSLWTIFQGIEAETIGLVHTAGVTEPIPSALADPALVERVLHPKVMGTRALDACIEAAPVTHVIAFGSIAAVWGSRDLAPYAAANGWLTGWAHQLQSRSIQARCVQWGPWASGGMIGDTEAYELGLYGLTPLNPAQACRAMEGAFGQSDPAPIVVEADWQTLCDHLSRTPSQELFTSLISTGGASHRKKAISLESPQPILDPNTASTIILREVEAILRPPTPIPTHLPLIEAGLDSLMATELRNVLREQGLVVPLGRLLGGPSIEELVAIALAPHAQPSPAQPEGEGDVPGWMLWTHLAALIVGAAIASGVAVLIQRLSG